MGMERKVIIDTLAEGEVFHYYRKVDGTRKPIGPYVIIGHPGDMIIAKRNSRKREFPRRAEVYVDMGIVKSDRYTFDEQELWTLMELRRNGFHMV